MSNNTFNPYVGLEFERNFSFRNGEYFYDPIVIENFWNSFNGKKKIDISSKKPIGVEFKYNDKDLILVNDTGYSEIEFPTSVYKDLNIHQDEFNFVFKKSIENIKEITGNNNLTLFCTGSHPTLIPSFENYYKYRTPKGHLYSIICEGSKYVKGRKWKHCEYISLTSDQINIDLPLGSEFELVKSLNRLMSIIVGMSANSAFVNGKPSGYKSIRQIKQYEILSNPTFEIEKTIVGMPKTEFNNFNEIFDILFTQRPMIFTGKGKESILYVPQKEDGNPPTLYEYLSQKEWSAKTIEGESTILLPEISEIKSPLQRINFLNIKPQLNFNESLEISIDEFLDAANKKSIHDLLTNKNVKTFIEIRTIDSALPGQEILMPAFIKGLTINYKETIKFAEKHFNSYELAYNSYFEAAKNGLDFKVNNRAANLYGLDLLEISLDGLRKVNNNNESHFLDRLKENLEKNQCPSDLLIKKYEKYGLQSVIDDISLTK